MRAKEKMNNHNNYLFSIYPLSSGPDNVFLGDSLAFNNAEEGSSSWGARFRDWLRSRYEQESTPQQTEPLTEYTSSAEGSDFNVTLQFIGEWTVEQQEAFISASDYLSFVIIGDISDIVLEENKYVRAGDVDDIIISVEMMDIDGEKGTLARGGPVYERDDATGLPGVGIIQVDSADIDRLTEYGKLEPVVLHEMVHALGFGSFMERLDLVTELGNSLFFNGENATTVYEHTFEVITNMGVPLENHGGERTAGSHWESSLFPDDLMAGVINAKTETELSDITLAALEDIGYETVFDLDTFLAG